MLNWKEVATCIKDMGADDEMLAQARSAFDSHAELSLDGLMRAMKSMSDGLNNRPVTAEDIFYRCDHDRSGSLSLKEVSSCMTHMKEEQVRQA